jgi:Fe2+ transport system protein B
MDTVSAVVTMLKELGTPAVMVIGFAWVIFKLNASKKDMSVLKTEVKADISELRTELKADIAALEAKVSSDIAELKSDVKSIKNNHLPHIEAAINELAKGTPNEAHVKAILDLSHKADL